jgi:hypothetical protein
LLLGSVVTEWAARLSPNGNWLAYESDESGEYEVYVRPLAGGGTRLQVSVDGGVEPIWSPDGKQLFYWRGEELMLATLTTLPVLSVTTRALVFRGDPPTTTGHANYDVSPDGAQIVLIRPRLDSIRTVVVHNWDRELRTRLAGTGR